MIPTDPTGDPAAEDELELSPEEVEEEEGGEEAPPPKPKGDPKKPSRREKIAKQREEREKELREELDAERQARKRTEDRLGRVEEVIYSEKEKKLLQQNLASRGVSEYDAEIYEQTKKDCLERGMPLEKAIKYAMIDATEEQKRDEDEEEAREEERRDIALPPSGGPKTAVPVQSFKKVSKEKYQTLIGDKQKELGSYQKAKEWVEQYNAHWDKKGEKPFVE